MDLSFGEYFLYGLAYIIVLIFAASPIIAIILYLSSYFAWYYDLKKKSIICIILAIIFSVLGCITYLTDWNAVFKEDDEYLCEERSIDMKC